MKKNYILCIISAILTALAFLVPSFAFLIWISLIPYINVMFKCSTSGEGFRFSFLFGVVFYLLLVSWLFWLYPLENIDISPILCFVFLTLAWILISVIMASELALMGYLFKKINAQGIFKPIVFAAFWVLLEFIQQYGEFGFTWGRIALSQYNYIPLIQSASLFGSLFISFIIILVNGFFAENRKYKFAIISVTIFVFNILLGFVSPDLNFDKTIKATLIWEDIDPNVKKSDGQISETYNLLMSETKKAEGDLVLWTETAVPVVLDDKSLFLNNYKQTAKSKEIILMVGGFRVEENTRFSSVVTISESGEVIGSVDKRHPVPFGEYIPFRNLIKKIYPKISEHSPDNEQISPAKNDGIVDTDAGKLGGLICYDSTFPPLARKSTKNGAEIFIVSTNDSWFYGSHATLNHLSQSVFRAVENGRFVLRSANLGESCIIDNTGKIIAKEKAGEHSLTGVALLTKDKTLYTLLGDIPVLCMAVIIILGSFIYNRRKRHII